MLVSNEIAFIEGQSYQFHMNAYGEISHVSGKGVHMFRSSVWPEYFQYQLEEGSGK